MNPYVKTIGYTKNEHIRHMSIAFKDDPYNLQVHFKFNQYGYTNIKAPDRFQKFDWDYQHRLKATEALRVAKAFVNKYFMDYENKKVEPKIIASPAPPKRIDILKFPKQMLMAARNSIF